MPQSEADDLAAEERIAEALRGIVIVVCPKCNGLGELREALNLTCPVCQGAGETTERREHEHTRDG